MQEEENLRNVVNTRSTTRQPETPFEAMLNAIGDSLSDLAYSDDNQDGVDKNDDEDTDLWKLINDDEPGWLIGTISKMIFHRIKSFGQTLIQLDKLRPPRWGDMADTSC
jgi:hypothetical protein